ncbi:MAG: radical SAM protein [Anaerolineales bacterium]|nr:radical SAM protein [Anaerolineales bacterium]
MQFVFGPVPSRRLGQSLGIDPVPLKTCNWNCVYCQLGRTRPVTNARKDYFPPEDILAEIQQTLDTLDPADVDWITFLGSGEPSLYASLGDLIRAVKESTDIPVAVITNGSLLYLPGVRQSLLPADAIMPSLDAGTADLYRKLNRPHPAVYFERYIEGLSAFRAAYSGKLWIEVMLIRDLNDTESALRAIAAHLDTIQPDEVHLSTPTRPPAEPWVQPPDEEGMLRARAILGSKAQVLAPIEGWFDLGEYLNVVDAIIAIITRHPMTEAELLQTLDRWTTGEVTTSLQELTASGRAQVVERYGTHFWSAAPAFYPDKN